LDRAPDDRAIMKNEATQIQFIAPAAVLQTDSVYPDEFAVQ
jgi:hypothetical protein